MLAMFAAAGAGAPAITVPVRHLVDRSLKLPPAQLQHYWADIWPECMRAFAASHIVVREMAGEATVERPLGEAKATPITFRTTAPGHYEAESTLASGNWDIDLAVTAEGGVYHTTRRLVAP